VEKAGMQTFISLVTSMLGWSHQALSNSRSICSRSPGIRCMAAVRH